MDPTFADKVLGFFRQLENFPAVPVGVEILNPYRNRETMKVVTRFYHQFYNDQLPRYLLIGINPGRYGAGLTGIPMFR